MNFVKEKLKSCPRMDQRVHAQLTILSRNFGLWYVVELRLGMFVSHFGHSRINIAIASATNERKKKRFHFRVSSFWSNFYYCSVPLQLKNVIFYETLRRPSLGMIFWKFSWIFMITGKSRKTRKKRLMETNKSSTLNSISARFTLIKIL